MQWEAPTYLWLLAIAPVLLLLFWWGMWQRRRQLRRLGDESLIQALMEGYSTSRRWLKTILSLLALACFVLALANLRMGSKREKAVAKSSEVIICFDVSSSMQATDVNPDRLTRARILAADIIQALAGNKVGLVVFAGNSYVQMPLTVDTKAALMYLNTLSTDMMNNQGTAIGDALETARIAFEQGGELEGKSRAVVIITDGETHDDAARTAAEELAQQNVRIITIGVGTPKGAPIPVMSRRGLSDYKKDKDGNIVLSKLNEAMLTELADLGNGRYMNLNEGKSVVRKVKEDVEGLDKSSGQEYTYAEYKNHFQIFLLLGIVLLLLEYMLSDKGSRWMRKLLEV
jgi:Ca-activated chloride channel family protein